MQIVIEIPEEIYNSACTANNIWDMRMAGFVCSAIANGTSLPKGHGRLIDADALLKEHPINTYTFPSIVVENAPTIIPATKEGDSE